MYPTISDYYNKMIGSFVIGKYDSVVNNTDKENIEAVFEKAQNYNKNLLKNPTGIKDGEPEDQNYLSQLKLNEDESIMGYIEIDKIKLRLPIYHGTSEPVLQKGVGHLEGTSLPVGGDGMHSVLTGHTGLPSAKLFTDLEKINLDDVIVLKILNKTLTYQVRNIEVVLPSEVENLKPIESKDMLTLVTCTPYGVNSHRLLVHAERIANLDDNTNMQTTDTDTNNIWTINSIVLVLSIVVLLIMIVIIKKKRK